MIYFIRTVVAVVATAPLLVFTAGSASAADGGVAGDVADVLGGVLADLIRILLG